MKIPVVAIVLSVAMVGSAFASPKDAAPISLARNTTVEARVTASAPSPVTESQFLVVADWDGDGVTDTGTLRVACRGSAVAFASFLPRDVSAAGGNAAAKSTDFKGSLAGFPMWNRSPTRGDGAIVFSVQHAVSDGKTMAADDWHAATVTQGAATVCPTR